MIVQNQLTNALNDYEDLKEKKLVTIKMKNKLDYLLASINDQKPPLSLINQLPEYQRLSLEQMKKKMKTELFINIVNCLTGNQIILYFKNQQAYIRKNQTFSIWSRCYLTFDSKALTVRKKIKKDPIYVFDINEIRVLKKFKKHRGKLIMGFMNKKKNKYLIGFKEEENCARIHEIIRNVIRDKSIKEVEQENEQKNQKIQQKETVQKQEQAILIFSNSKVEQVEIIDQDDETNIFEEISIEEISMNRDYNVLKNYDEGRILVNSKRPHRIKMIVKVKCMNPLNVIESYLRMNEWNPEVEECSIKTKLCDNNYLMVIKFKQYSYFSWPRYAHVVATATVIEGKHYLVIRNVEEESSSESKDMVKMIFHQALQVCTHSENKDTSLLTLVTEVDHQGYSSFEDSKNMTLKFLIHFEHFSKFISTEQISKNGSQIYFNFERKKLVKKIMKEKLEEKQVSMLDIEQSFIGNESKDLSISSQNSLEKEITGIEIDFTKYTLKQGQNSQIQEELVSMIKDKKIHENYYLRQYFDQKTPYDPKRCEHIAEGKNNYFFQNSWFLNSDQQIVLNNEKLLQIQKNAFKLIIKHVGSTILSGKSIMNISLPVEMFGDDSFLERIAHGFGFLPKYIIPAAQCQDIIEQAKLVSAFFSTIPALHVNTGKPFNPILGETFECKLGGISLYFEQVSHHPPISAVYAKTDTFRFYGSSYSIVQLSLNAVTGINLNLLTLQFFKTKTIYQGKLPQFEATGTLYGQRKYQSIGKSFIHEKNNHLWTQISYGKDKKKVYPYKEGKMKRTRMVGGIYTVTSNFAQKYINCEVKRKFQGVTPDDIVKKHVEIDGHWGTELRFNGEVVRTLENPAPNKPEYLKYPLPSDSNFRPDVIYKRMEKISQANRQKQILQEIQRRDKKLRLGQIKTS